MNKPQKFLATISLATLLLVSGCDVNKSASNNEASNNTPTPSPETAQSKVQKEVTQSGSQVKPTQKTKQDQEQEVDPEMVSKIAQANRINAVYNGTYKMKPKPPVGNWKPELKKFLIGKDPGSDKEQHDLMRDYELKHPNTDAYIIREEDGLYYLVVDILPPKELIDWSNKYNLPIPGKHYLYKVDKENKAFVEYEKWFFGK